MRPEASSDAESPRRPEDEGGPSADSPPDNADERLLEELRSLLEPRPGEKPDGAGLEGHGPAEGQPAGQGLPEDSSIPTDQLIDVLLALASSDGEGAREPGAERAHSGAGDARGRRIGHYRLVRLIGSGAQGDVYLAEDTRLSRRVALKVLAVPFLGAAGARERFRREAAIASRLDDPGICSVYDAGDSDGASYIAMRYLEGRTLADIIAEARDEKPLAVASSTSARERIQQRVRLVERVARSLHRAHEAGLVHRDIKPGNIFVTEAGDPVILDFGLARDEESELTTLTRSRDILGTPAYMSPEQISGGSIRVDARSDVYSLGVVLYECLTLERPFQAPTREALYQRILTSTPPDPRKLNPQVSKDLKVILETALEKDRDRRYQTALDLAEDLRRVRSREPIRVRSPGVALRFLRWSQRNPALAASALGLFLALFVGLAISLILLRAMRIERDRKELALWESLVSQARATLRSDRPGRRFESLDVIREAARMHVGPELRDAAIAALALSDLRPVNDPVQVPADALFVAHDEAGKRRAWMDRGGTVHVVREGQGDEFTLDAPVAPRDPRDVYVRLSCDGDFLAVRIGEAIRAWDLEQREQRLSIAPCARKRAFEFSPDARWLASGQTDGCVHLHDIESGKEIRILTPGNTGYVPYSVRFHRREDLVAACSEASPAVHVWDLAAGHHVVIRPRISVPGIDWHPSRRILAGASADSRVFLWDIDHPGDPIITLPVLPMMTSGVLFTEADGHLLVSGRDGALQLWNLVTEESLLSARGVLGFGEPRWRDGDRLLTINGPPASQPHWNVAASGECRAITGKSAAVSSLAFSPDGRLLVVGLEASLQIRATATGRLLGTLPTKHASRCVAWITPPSGEPVPVVTELILASFDHVQRWPVVGSSGQLRFGPPEILRVVPAPRAAVAVSEDGSRLAAVYSERNLVVDSFRAPRQEAVLLGTGVDFDSVAIDPSGRLVAAGNSSQPGVQVFDIASRSSITDLATADPSDVLFAPTGEWLIAASVSEARIWRCDSWDLALRLERERPAAREAMAFSADGRFLALPLSASQITLFNASSLDVVARLEAPDSSRVQILSFSRGGRWLAAGGEGVHLWDLGRIAERLDQLGIDAGDLRPACEEPGGMAVPESVEVEYSYDQFDAAQRDAITRAIEERLDPRSTAILYGKRARWHGLRGDTAADLADLTRGIELSPQDSLNLRGMRLQVLLQAGRIEEALDDLDWLIEHGTPTTETYAQRAGIQLNLGRIALARRDLEKALELDPGRLQYADNLAWLLAAGPEEERDAGRALELMRGVVERNPDEPRFAITLGLAYFRVERWEEARRILASLEVTDRPTLEVLKCLLLAMLQERLGDRDGGAEIYRRALRIMERSGNLGSYIANLRAEADAIFAEGASEEEASETGASRAQGGESAR
ncbi:MAG: protein kinase [Planctomycetes bacterium]|nr:protein kinase [Planctomycetota bacterium]